MLTIATLVATVLSLLPVRAWPLELLASFRVQITLISLFAALAAISFRMHRSAALALLLTTAQAGILAPIFVNAGVESSKGDDEITLLTLNVEWTNRSDKEILDTIRGADADIVVVEEVDSWWRERLATLDDLFPYRYFDPVSSRPGVAVLSRTGALSEEWRPLQGRAFVTLRFQPVAKVFRLTALHALPPRSPLLYRARNRQLDGVAAHLARLERSEPLPTLAAGDFNTTPWSPVMRDFLERTGLVDVRAGRGALPTWPSWNPLLCVPIDHILHSREIGVENVERLQLEGSDHIGLLSRLTLG